MGFNYSGLKGVGHRHVFVPGNHDNYDNLPEQALPGYGMVVMGPWQFFHVRGEWSIDIRQRADHYLKGGQKIWWAEEELTKQEMEEAFNLYKEAKPDVVMTHGCPISISEMVGNPGVWKYFGWDEKQTTNTQLMLEYMLQTHRPKLWLFGHYHRNWERLINDTKFICVDELSYIDFNENWEALSWTGRSS
jgi:DNA repair exonuclease SbcCD nuclease subunit